MKHIRILLFVVLFITIACICGSTSPSAPPQKIGEVTAAPTNTTLQIYKVGDVIQVGNLNIVLNSADFQGNLLVANFTIENKGNDELTISTSLLFTAKDADGVDLEEEIFECGTSSIGGSILPGDKSKGNVCYKNVLTNTARIYFNPALFSSQTLVWEVNK